MNLPWDYNNEIHDVPWISKVASFVKNESISQDFDHHFYLYISPYLTFFTKLLEKFEILTQKRQR